MLFPFMGWIVRATYRLVPGTDALQEDEYELYYIGKGKVVLKTSGEWDFFISSMEEEVAKNLGFVVDIGKYPEKEDELLISHYLLKETDYQIGDTITIDVNQAMKSEYLDGKAEENEILVPKTYKIVALQV